MLRRFRRLQNVTKVAQHPQPLATSATSSNFKGPCETLRNVIGYFTTFSNLSNQGIILLNIVIILLTIAIIGASLMTFYFSVDILARAIADGTKAFYLAEAGMASGVNYLRTQAEQIKTPTAEIGPMPLGEGEYQVEIDFAHSIIVSKGRVNDVEKTLQLQFNTL